MADYLTWAGPNPEFQGLINPKFIVFEGIDGSGKSSLIQEVGRLLGERGKKVLYAREPGTTLVGERVRSLVKEEDLHPRVSHLLIESARLSTLLSIEKFLTRKPDVGVVLGDRHTDSSWAYQGAMGVDQDYIEMVQSTYSDLPRPDLTIYFDASLTIARTRINVHRGKGSDVFDNEGEEFFSTVKSRYEAKVLSDRQKYFVVDADKSIGGVLLDLIPLINKVFPQ